MILLHPYGCLGNFTTSDIYSSSQLLPNLWVLPKLTEAQMSNVLSYCYDYLAANWPNFEALPLQEKRDLLHRAFRGYEIKCQEEALMKILQQYLGFDARRWKGPNTVINVRSAINQAFPPGVVTLMCVLKEVREPQTSTILSFCYDCLAYKWPNFEGLQRRQKKDLLNVAFSAYERCRREDAITSVLQKYYGFDTYQWLGARIVIKVGWKSYEYEVVSP